MTFAVRTITRSLAGRDIAHKPEVLDVSELTIGRGAECDIRLSDLAVSLRHAQARQAGPGRIHVESLGAEPFEADGKFTKSATLDLANKPRLVFGSHVLVFSAGEDPGEVLVDVTRLETGPETAAEANEDKIFSLKSLHPGKRPIAWTLASLFLLLCLILPIGAYLVQANRHIHADQQWSSGPLSKSHAFLSRNCQACHVKAFVSVQDSTCLSCHAAATTPEAAAQVAETERKWGGPEKVTLVRDHAAHDLIAQVEPLPDDLNGKVQAVFRRTFNHPNDRCASCHLEHLADTKAKAAPGSTLPASQRPRETPTLKVTIGCVQCHAKIREELDNTTLRDTPDWGHHPDFRPLIARRPFGNAPPILDRISLVERPSDYTGLNFSHQEHLSTTGGVARMAAGLHMPGGGLTCADCHRANKAGGFAPVEMTRDCAACHSLAYAPGPNGTPLMLPHGHPNQVVATLESYYGGGGVMRVSGPSREPPGFLARFGQLFTGAPSHSESGAAAGKIRALFAARGLCSECHAAAAPVDPASLDYRIVPIHITERYLPRGAFNHDIREHNRDAAGNPTCESCHDERQSASASDVMLPRIGECASCHGKTKAKTPTAASGACEQCHSYHAPGVATRKSEPVMQALASFDADAPGLWNVLRRPKPHRG